MHVEKFSTDFPGQWGEILYSRGMTDDEARARAARDTAIEKAGGGSSLARKLGLTRGAVHHWDVVPSKHLMRVAQLTGIPAAELRPDLMPAQAPA